MTRRNDEESIISSTPRQSVVFYPFVNRFKSVTKKNLLVTRRIDATSFCKNLNYSRSKSDASGKFSLELTSDRNWKHVLRPGDWGAIYLSQFGIDNESNKGMLALINVDRVSRSKTIARDGTISFRYLVSGRDFGKIFEKTRFYYNPYVPEKVQQNFVFLKSGIKVTGSPETFVRSYLSLYFGNGFIEGGRKGVLEKDEINKKLEKLDQLQIPPAIYKLFGVDRESGKLSDILRVDIGGVRKSASSDEDRLRPEGYSWAIPPDRAVSGSVWDILQSVSNPLMNEIFLSMKYYPAEDKVFPTLTLRKLPFSGHTSHKRGRRAYTSLNSMIIQENMIITDDLGFNDHERYNFINFDPQIPRISGYKQFMAASQATRFDPFLNQNVPLFPFINKASIKRFGFTEMPGLSSEFVMVERGDKKTGREKTDIKLAERWLEELIEWWSEYERYESGTLMLKGFSQVNQISTSRKTGLPLLNGRSLPPIAKASIKARLGKKKKLLTPADFLNIGENLYLNSRDRLVHMEGINHQWKAPGSWDITVIVTRGVATTGKDNPKGAPYKFVDEVESDEQTEIVSTFVERRRN